MKPYLLISPYRVTAKRADMLPPQGCRGNVADRKADRKGFFFVLSSSLSFPQSASHFQAYHSILSTQSSCSLFLFLFLAKGALSTCIWQKEVPLSGVRSNNISFKHIEMTPGKFQLGMTGVMGGVWWGVKRCGRMKVELHLFLTDWYRHGGNFTRCLFDHAFRMHVSY